MTEQTPTISGGVDPDSRARTHLANERTFLAWLRTGLGLIVVGIGAAQFLDLDQGIFPGPWVVWDFAALLIVCGTRTAVIGGMRYARSREEIDAANFQPAGTAVVVAMIVIVVISVLSLALVTTLDRT